jgi:NADPH:quinone reductase-like Zn-dependent oxidoreductase
MRKTQTITKQTISVMLVVMLFSTNSAFAQKQNIEAENNGPMHNLLFMGAALLFIVGFTVLYALKMRDDNKHHPKQNRNPQTPFRHHPNHYGRRHQFHR